MITVRTFLRSQDGAFQELDTWRTPPVDPDYIEGAIELDVDGVEIVGRSQWDYVDQFWAYIADVVRVLATRDEASTYLPDQPIMLTFERDGSRILVSSRTGETTKRASADESELLQALKTAGRAFFEKMSELVPANADGYRIALDNLAER